jgi:hypothetical protein
MVKVKLSLCLISEAICHEDIWESGDIAPSFLTLAIYGGKWLASCPCHFTPGERAPQYPMDIWLVGPQSQSVYCEEEKKLALPGIEPSTVTVPTELS